MSSNLTSGSDPCRTYLENSIVPPITRKLWTSLLKTSFKHAPPPPVTSPFDYLVRQIQTDLNRAASLCLEVERNHRLGRGHHQLDALNKALSDGITIIQQEYIADLPGTDSDGGDGSRFVIRIKVTKC